MTSLGMLLFLFGYALLYWGIQAIGKNKQPKFVSYVLPFAA